MSGTVIVGIILALMFLVSFSEWFYHVVVGLNVLIVNDIFVYYRIASWGIGVILFMAGVFWMLALTHECPLVDEPKEGLFKYLNCDVYFKGKQLTDRIGLTSSAPTGVTEDFLE